MKIEKRYAALFKNKKGKVAKALRLALGALIIQTEYQYSDEETVLQIQEGAYLQYFCGLSEHKYEQPFDPSLMVYFRKRLTPEILGEINELIIDKANPKKEPFPKQDADVKMDDDKQDDDHNEPKPPSNTGN